MDAAEAEELRKELQTKLQLLVDEYVTKGVQAPIALQECSRLVADVMYRIADASGWVGDETLIEPMVLTAYAEIFQTLKMLCTQDPDKEEKEEPPKLH